MNYIKISKWTVLTLYIKKLYDRTTVYVKEWLSLKTEKLNIYLSLRIQEDIKEMFEEKCKKNYIVPSVLIRGLIDLYNTNNKFYTQPSYSTIFSAGTSTQVQYRITKNGKQRFLKNCKKNKNTTPTEVIKGWMQQFLLAEDFAKEVVQLFKNEANQDGKLDDRMLIHIESGLKDKIFNKCPQDKTVGYCFN